MKVLVTGADGFVGRYLLRALVGRGDEVLAAVRPGGPEPATWLPPGAGPGVEVMRLEITDPESRRAVAAREPDAAVHLAAVASGAEARERPVATWEVNALGTVGLLEELAARAPRAGDLRTVVVSTGEVYGRGTGRALTEDDPVRPVSPYAASKAAAELGVAEIVRRTGLAAVVARPFPHTGVGQTTRYVVPGFIQRMLTARAEGRTEIATGNLEPVRDFLDVRDVVRAYLALLDEGSPGECYNVARGVGHSIAEIFSLLARLMEGPLEPRPDPGLVRPADIPHLVGDPHKLSAATGWHPTIPLDQTLREMLDAQTQ